jgi:hypothetical protein
MSVCRELGQAEKPAKNETAAKKGRSMAIEFDRHNLVKAPAIATTVAAGATQPEAQHTQACLVLPG